MRIEKGVRLYSCDEIGIVTEHHETNLKKGVAWILTHQKLYPSYKFWFKYIIEEVLNEQWKKHLERQKNKKGYKERKRIVPVWEGDETGGGKIKCLEAFAFYFAKKRHSFFYEQYPEDFLQETKLISHEMKLLGIDDYKRGVSLVTTRIEAAMQCYGFRYHNKKIIEREIATEMSDNLYHLI